MPPTHGARADGTPITDEMIEAMADEAECGYNVEKIRRRNRGGRPTDGFGGILGRVGALRSGAQA